MKTSGNGNVTSVSRRELLMSGAGAVAASAIPSVAGWAQSPKRGGTLRLSNGADPPDFDLHQSATYLTLFVGSPCYSTLLRIDPNDVNKLVPDLAERFEISGDGKAVTFSLLSGVTFHNGMPMTADDVVFSLERIRKPPSGIVSPRKGLLGNVQAFEAKDPTTVVAHLEQPQTDFPFLVSNPYNVVM